MRRIIQILSVSVLVFASHAARAQYAVWDVTGNASLSAIEGLSSNQVQLLSQILSENKQQLQSLLAIQSAINGTGPGSGGGLPGGLSTGSIGGGLPSNFNSGGGIPSNFNTGGGIPSFGGGVGSYQSGGTNFGSGFSSNGGIGGIVDNGNYSNAINGVVNAAGGGQVNNAIGGVANTVQGVQNILNHPGGASVDQLRSLVKGIPGLSNFDLKSMFPANGYLDIFMGMNPDQFKQAVSSPSNLLSSSIMNKAIGDMGGSSDKKGGPNAAEIMFGARVSSMSETERQANSDNIAHGVANIMSARVIKGLEEAHNRGATFSAMTKDLSDKNDNANTVMDKMTVANQQSAVNAQMAIDANERAANAAASSSGQSIVQTNILDMEQNRNAIRDSIGKKN